MLDLVTAGLELVPLALEGRREELRNCWSLLCGGCGTQRFKYEHNLKFKAKYCGMGSSQLS